MPAIRGITVCVGKWYSDLLRVTLVRNARHFTECMVVTSPEDRETQEVARSVPGVRVHITDAFTRPDANGVRPLFNKGHSLEESFSVFGRDGWLCVWDSDVIFPDALPLDRLRPDCLHGARRRVLEDPAAWHPGLDWSRCPVLRDGRAPIGFFQLFHADSIKDKPVWYDVSFPHAGGGDCYFIGHWPPGKRVVLPLDVLHLGPVDRNWFGTSPEARDLMARYVHQNQWPRAMRNFTAEEAARAGELPGRVEVPGYAPSSFELPFERRARGGK